MPAALLEPQNQSRLIDAWFAASRHWWVSLHFNKGLAGAAEEAIAAARTTAMNPDVLTAFALAIIGDASASLFTGASPDPGAHARAERVQAAMIALTRRPGRAPISTSATFSRRTGNRPSGVQTTRASPISRNATTPTVSSLSIMASAAKLGALTDSHARHSIRPARQRVRQ